MPILKFNKCDYDCSDKRDKWGNLRVYCRRLDKKCKPQPTTSPALVPLPKLPPIDTRPKRFFKKEEYIGISFKREEHGQWVESLRIKRFFGRPYNIYEFKVIIGYTDPMWEALIARVEYEAQQPGREAVIGDDSAYSVTPIITVRPATRVE